MFELKKMNNKHMVALSGKYGMSFSSLRLHPLDDGVSVTATITGSTYGMQLPNAVVEKLITALQCYLAHGDMVEPRKPLVWHRDRASLHFGWVSGTGAGAGALDRHIRMLDDGLFHTHNQAFPTLAEAKAWWEDARDEA